MWVTTPTQAPSAVRIQRDKAPAAGCVVTMPVAALSARPNTAARSTQTALA